MIPVNIRRAHIDARQLNSRKHGEPLQTNSYNINCIGQYHFKRHDMNYRGGEIGRVSVPFEAKRNVRSKVRLQEMQKQSEARFFDFVY